MKQTRFIDSRQFIADIRSGLGSDKLMGKYDLTQSQFNRTLQKVIDSKMLSESEVMRLKAPKQRQVNLEELAGDVKELLRKHRLTLNEFGKLMDRIRNSSLLTDTTVHEVMVRPHKKEPKRKINAMEFAEDIQLGMDHGNLMIKYNLTENQIDMIIERLIAAKLLTEAEVYDRSVAFDTQIFHAKIAAQKAIDEIE